MKTTNLTTAQRAALELIDAAATSVTLSDVDEDFRDGAGKDNTGCDV
jgi:hypothetical protein